VLTAARIVGVLIGVVVGLIVDEALFPDTEWTSAITPLVFAIAGWIAATTIVRRLIARSVSSS